MFSKACEYAIRATVRIAQATAADERIALKTIAEETGAPEAFTAKVLQKLVRAGVIGSMKGPGGGFNLTPSRAKKLALSTIVDTIDGDGIYTNCALGLPQCDPASPCPLHDRFMAVREDLRQLLSSTTVYDLVNAPQGAKGHLILK